MLNGDENVLECMNNQIDFEKVLMLVSEKRRSSLDFLINALNN